MRVFSDRLGSYSYIQQSGSCHIRHVYFGARRLRISGGTGVHLRILRRDHSWHDDVSSSNFLWPGNAVIVYSWWLLGVPRYELLASEFVCFWSCYACFLEGIAHASDEERIGKGQLYLEKNIA